MLGVHLKIIIRFNLKKMILVYRKKRQQQKFKKWFLLKKVKWSYKLNSGINPFTFLPIRTTVNRAKDAHGSQRSKLLLGCVWVKYVLVEWLLSFRIMGTDLLWSGTGLFEHVTCRNADCSVPFTDRKSIVNRWSVSRYLVMNSIKERFDSMDGTKSEAVQKIQERFQPNPTKNNWSKTLDLIFYLS